jgi:hypothetical protein
MLCIIAMRPHPPAARSPAFKQFNSRNGDTSEPRDEWNVVSRVHLEDAADDDAVHRLVLPPLSFGLAIAI